MTPELSVSISFNNCLTYSFVDFSPAAARTFFNSSESIEPDPSRSYVLIFVCFVLKFVLKFLSFESHSYIIFFCFFQNLPKGFNECVDFST